MSEMHQPAQYQTPGVTHPSAHNGPAPGTGNHAYSAQGSMAHDGTIPGMAPGGMVYPGVGAGLQVPQQGRDQIHWSPEVWHRIDAAVREEIMRSRCGAKFLQTVHVPPKATTVPADVVNIPAAAAAAPGAPSTAPAGALFVDETATDQINEIWVEFSLTAAQVEEEEAAIHAIHNQHDAQHHL